MASTTENDTTGKSYTRLTEGTFKQRYTQHKLSFQNRNYSNSRELSKHIWTLKDNNTNFAINWSILATAPAYSNKSKRCHLCLTEKLYLVRAKKPSLLNKRTELISKCRHENKFYSANFIRRSDHHTSELISYLSNLKLFFNYFLIIFFFTLKMIHQMDQRSKCSQTQIENLRRERQELSEVICDSSEHLIYNLK